MEQLSRKIIHEKEMKVVLQSSPVNRDREVKLQEEVWIDQHVYMIGEHIKCAKWIQRTKSINLVSKIELPFLKWPVNQSASCLQNQKECQWTAESREPVYRQQKAERRLEKK